MPRYEVMRWRPRDRTTYSVIDHGQAPYVTFVDHFEVGLDGSAVDCAAAAHGLAATLNAQNDIIVALLEFAYRTTIYPEDA